MWRGWSIEMGSFPTWGCGSFPARPHTRDVQSDPVQPGLRCQVERFAVIIALCHVVRVLGACDGSQVFTVERDSVDLAPVCPRG